MSLSINLPKTCGPRIQAWLRFYLILRKMSLSINLPKACGPRIQAWLRFYLTLRNMSLSINLPKAYGLRIQAWLRFCLTLRKMLLSINLPKACGPRIQAWLNFYLTLRKMSENINLPKVYGSRSQIWARFYLIFKSIIESTTHNVINKKMTRKTFINNNTFSGCLHSRGVLQHFHLDLQDNMHLFQSPRWCDTALPSWALTFLMPSSLQYLKPFLIPSLQVPVALASRWHHTFAWACVDNRPIEPWQFLFILQLSLSSSLTAYHCCLELVFSVGNPVSRGITASAS